MSHSISQSTPSPVSPSVAAAAYTARDGFDRPDVLILGGGLAGLTLARQLLLGGGLKVLLVDRKEELPGPRQKVGESSVQLAGHYFSKVLDLEEHLLHDHFMKYNLRFYWPAPGRSGTGFEDYSQSYIRHISNVPSYQLDRNRLEEHLLELNSQDSCFRHALGIRKPEVELVQGEGESHAGEEFGPRHRVCFTLDGTEQEVHPRWVVDATGRNRSLARQMELTDPGRIRHGTFFLWVDGLVDIERLTARSRERVRRSPDRRHVGHMPLWMATNHFMGDGLWLWVIPLRGKTSIGLVYDRATFDHKEVAGPDKLIEWICREFPCFGHDLPRRKVLDWGGFKDFAHDSKATISSDRWAVSGVAGRFSDPLYSPGSDLIAIYNTLIVHAIRSPEEELEARCAMAERQMQAVFGAYIPSYAESYQTLGDPECFSLKYTWELAVYFAYYVFPFLNDLLTDRRFALAHLRLFSELGPINHGVQKLLAGYHQWKRNNPGLGDPPPDPVFFDFTSLQPLAETATTFYEMGVSVERARTVLTQQLEHLKELARFIAAHVASRVLNRPEAVYDRGFVEALPLSRLRFEPEAWEELWQEHGGGMGGGTGDGTGGGESYPWALDPSVVQVFHDHRGEAAAPPPAGGEPTRGQLVEAGGAG